VGVLVPVPLIASEYDLCIVWIDLEQNMESCYNIVSC
jgi:hypothetical protein